jgi:hypothetical protein
MKAMAGGWDAAVSSWAAAQLDISALVQIGSRVQPGATADEWSDYDYHLITTRPDRYRDGSFARGLGPCWACGAQTAFGNATKVSAVFDGALEVDFVVLRRLDIVILSAAMRWPATGRLWPSILRKGVESFRIVAAPGWKVIKGGALWERRYSRIAPFRAPLSRREFDGLCGEFWTQLVWAAKKAARGEFRASQRALHMHLLENSLRMMQEEALMGGRKAYPFGRRAEGWLTEEERRATQFQSGPDRASLAAALERVAGIFSEASAAVAAGNGWEVERHPEIRAWLAGLGLR